MLAALKSVGRAISAFINSVCQGFKFIFSPLYLVGMVTLVRRRAFTFTIVFVSLLAGLHILLLLGLHVSAGYIAHRHLLPLVGLAMPFTALGIVVVGERLARRTKARGAYAAWATLGVCTAVVLPYTLRPFCREFVPVIEATRWVEAHAEPSAGIVCNSPYVGFYGTLPTAELGPQSPTLDEAVAKAAVAARYDYVILHVGGHAYRPEWLAQIEQRYRQIQELPDPYCLPKRPRKVLVFEARHLEARRAENGPHS
jgi:hypothetical protein